MKKIIITSIVTATMLIIGVYAIAAINFKTAELTDKFTAQDVLDTNIVIDEFYCKKISETWSADTGTTVTYDVPELILDGADYKVERTQYTFTFSPQDLDDCMDGGTSKADCIARAKTKVANEIMFLKLEVMSKAEKIQRELNDVDYTGQLKDGDFTITEGELNGQ
jgi:hypothetical protein